jgi:glycine/D-amino acid oxidase-like deaminating enzyme
VTATPRESSYKVHSRSDDLDALVIGGGFYGCRLALALAATGRRVLLVEREPALMARASLRNQARVHGGYHYPRSILTSRRSRHNYARFVAEYAECIDSSFAHYYAIARGMSKITGTQFAEFCRRIGAPLAPAPDAVVKLFDASRIDAVFAVQECAFDAVALRERMTRDLANAGVTVRCATEAVHLASGGVPGAPATVRLRDALTEWVETADLVLNCTYAGLNQVLAASAASIVPAKHELAEMALVEPPPELHGAAVTVMDGPFFSLMPYPSRGGLFTLSHVRYTPHYNWHDATGQMAAPPPAAAHDPVTRFTHMMRDAERYLPAMRHTRYVESLFETKILMPRSEQDDSRPILFRRSIEHPALISVLGAKIDSVYDVEDALAAALAGAMTA